MCGINASRGQKHGCRFTMCHASLNMALLLHKEGLVKTTVPITVNVPKNFPFLENMENKSYVVSNLRNGGWRAKKRKLVETLNPNM